MHSIHQGEGGEQGDACPLVLFGPTCNIGRHLPQVTSLGERLFAFLDDIWFVTKPERVGDVHSLAERELWREAGIQVYTGKSHLRSATPSNSKPWFRGSNTSGGHQSVWLSSWPRRFHRHRVAGFGCARSCCRHPATRANCVLRVLRRDMVQRFVQHHDTNVWQCFCNAVTWPESQPHFPRPQVGWG